MKSSLLLCFLDFRLAPSGLNIMQYFSFRQSCHERLVGLYGVNSLVFAINFLDIEWGVFFPQVSRHVCWTVPVFCFSLLKLDLCLLKHFLNRPLVNPVYVSGGFHHALSLWLHTLFEGDSATLSLQYSHEGTTVHSNSCSLSCCVFQWFPSC